MLFDAERALCVIDGAIEDVHYWGTMHLQEMRNEEDANRIRYAQEQGSLMEQHLRPANPANRVALVPAKANGEGGPRNESLDKNSLPIVDNATGVITRNPNAVG